MTQMCCLVATQKTVDCLESNMRTDFKVLILWNGIIRA